MPGTETHCQGALQLLLLPALFISYEAVAGPLLGLAHRRRQTLTYASSKDVPP